MDRRGRRDDRQAGAGRPRRRRRLRLRALHAADGRGLPRLPLPRLRLPPPLRRGGPRARRTGRAQRPGGVRRGDGTGLPRRRLRPGHLLRLPARHERPRRRPAAHRGRTRRGRHLPAGGAEHVRRHPRERPPDRPRHVRRLGGRLPAVRARPARTRGARQPRRRGGHAAHRRRGGPAPLGARRREPGQPGLRARPLTRGGRPALTGDPALVRLDAWARSGRPHCAAYWPWWTC
ncbi:hypothetical protein SBRY_140136 [Actinacidiphila bryophytorum]|uniref:Uncharacterized protein n=1 Tax=Actinacidiphila bryophytorum TaxID=1436133 RepID=A0A9W4E8R9_9ACTN|nr:hypothetical protein SBRY_140136 [Actinacidiphila bryophytorum]